MASPANFLAQFRIGSRISFLILLIFVSQILLINPSVFAGSVDHSVTVTSGNAAPIVSGVTLNNGSAITLTANATTSIRVNFTITDTNDCTDVFVSGRVTTTVHRNGVSSTCKLALATSSADLRSCYFVSTTTHNCTSGSSANATSVIDIYYFADATDASSSLAGDSWGAFVQAQDAAGEVHSSTASAVELNTLLAVDVSTSTNYGSIAIGSDTSSTNQIATVKNAGNASTSLMINGIAMSLGGGGTTTIPTSSQHYATTTFTYGGVEQVLQETATAVSGILLSPKYLRNQWVETTATPLRDGPDSHGVAAYNGHIYVSGGYIDPTAETSSVHFAQQNANGTLGSWAQGTSLPHIVRGHGFDAHNGYLYKMGGIWGGGATSSIYFAPINTTGSIGAWTHTQSIPFQNDTEGRYYFGSAIYNNYLYILGGCMNGCGAGSMTSSVHFAPINATGSLGSFTATTAMPADRTFFKAFAGGGFLYAVGGCVSGCDATVTNTSSVIYAPINATGSIGSWSQARALPSELYRFGLSRGEDSVFVIGGLATTTATSTIYEAHLGASGHISGGWVEVKRPSSTASSYQLSGSVLHRGYLYILGGCIDTGACTASTNTVSYAPLSNRNTYWGLGFPATTTVGTYLGTNTFTAVFSP